MSVGTHTLMKGKCGKNPNNNTSQKDIKKVRWNSKFQPGFAA